jgi:hypothetical protein
LYKDKTERATLARFEDIRRHHGMVQVPTLLSGAVGTGLTSMVGDYQPMGMQKFDNFQEYAQLYSPEHKFCFIGGNLESITSLLFSLILNILLMMSLDVLTGDGRQWSR